VSAQAGSPDRGAPAVLLIAVHSAAPGGAQAMALAQAEHFAGRCSIVAAVPEGPLRERFAACGAVIAPAPSLPTWEVSPGRWALQLLRSCLDAFRLARTIRRRKVDAVLTSSTVLLAPVLAARLAGVPSFAHAREWPTSRSGKAVFWLQRHCADVVVAISAGVAARFAGRGRARVVCIADGITAAEGERPPAAFGRPLRLCVIGSLTGGDGKGQHRGVETLAQLESLGVDSRLSVVGPVLDEAYAERVRMTARRLGVAERVELTGSVEDVPGLLRDHDILLFCSSQGADVTPLVLMEALVEERPRTRRRWQPPSWRWSPIPRRRGSRRGAARRGCGPTTTAGRGSIASGMRSTPGERLRAAHKFPRLSSVSQTIAPVIPWPKSTARTA
jgi:glycosyltransferase involved in cell wall biosynthesis